MQGQTCLRAFGSPELVHAGKRCGVGRLEPVPGREITPLWIVREHRQIPVLYLFKLMESQKLQIVIVQDPLKVRDVELVLIHVVESAASRYLGEDALDAESRADALALARIATEFTRKGVRARVRLGNGQATREIARIVAEESADLVITGSHGHSGLADMVYGNTVSGVRHLVRCPVLTVPRVR